MSERELRDNLIAHEDDGLAVATPDATAPEDEERTASAPDVTAPAEGILAASAQDDAAAEPEEMDLEEAALVAKLLAKMMVSAEGAATVLPQDTSAADTPADESSIAAGKKRFGKANARQKKYTLPLLIIEGLVVIILVIVIGKYFHVAPQTPVQYADSKADDRITCQNGKLIYNDVSAKVPVGDNVKYSISYSWAEGDTDYPSVPQAIVASYPGSDDSILYEISLYRDSFTAKKDIPKGKNAENWFSDWETEHSYTVYKFPFKVGDIRGFCITNMHADKLPEDYRTYTYYFAVPENGGISVYTLEGTCYAEDQREKFNDIFKKTISTVSAS